MTTTTDRDQLREALQQARDYLLEVGNDYPGSSCQKWCTEKAREVWNAVKPWEHCPSTHCERAQECRSVNECAANKLAALATPTAQPSDRDQLREAAINQNDAMRQELANVGNAVSDLARAMGVDQANDDGTWPDLLGRVGKIEAAVLASKPALDPATIEREAWHWLAQNSDLEISYYGWDDYDEGWQVHRVNGGRNDREWTLIATEATPLKAVQAAIRASVETRT